MYDGAFNSPARDLKPLTSLGVVKAQRRSNFAWILFDSSIFVRECEKELGNKPLGRILLTRTPIFFPRILGRFRVKLSLRSKLMNKPR